MDYEAIKTKFLGDVKKHKMIIQADDPGIGYRRIIFSRIFLMEVAPRITAIILPGAYTQLYGASINMTRQGDADGDA